ncbi:MAG: transketolase C-terminal domain-containing protein [Candidatus Peregrinibacteria bacterium]
MRNAFVRTLLALARNDPNILLLTGDLGYSVFEEFRDTLPHQYLNVGVMEQNMVSVAAGLALNGKKVFTYSIIPFATFRCFEQIRNDVCYHRLPVCIVGVGAGYSYGSMGATHHTLEDIAVMRSLPDMTVVCPGDPVEAEGAVRAIVAASGPCYLRLGKAGEPKLHAEGTRIVLGSSIEMRRGTAVTLIATSTMLQTAVEVTERLSQQNISARLLSMHTVKPIDAEAVLRAARETPLIVTLEEHSPIGGLGSAVAEALSLHGVLAHHLLCAGPDAFATFCGSQDYLRRQCGLDPETICARVTERLHSL